MRFSSGALLTMCFSHINLAPYKVFEITGTEGTYLFDHRAWELIKRDGAEKVSTSGRNPDNEWWRYYKNVAAHLVRGTRLIIPPEWARRPIHILDLADRSASKGVFLKAKHK